MYYKIICCPCCAEVFKETEKEIISDKNNFHCGCNRNHEIYVWKCPSRPLVCNIQNPCKKCFCNECIQYEICAVCVEKRYNLNYRCKKYCLNYLREYKKTHGRLFFKRKNEFCSIFFISDII